MHRFCDPSHAECPFWGAGSPTFVAPPTRNARFAASDLPLLRPLPRGMAVLGRRSSIFVAPPTRNRDSRQPPQPRHPGAAFPSLAGRPSSSEPGKSGTACDLSGSVRGARSPQCPPNARPAVISDFEAFFLILILNTHFLIQH